ICVSHQVIDLVRGKVNYPAIELKNARLKNISREVRVYRILLPWEPSPWWVSIAPFTLHTADWKHSSAAIIATGVAAGLTVTLWFQPVPAPPATPALAALASAAASTAPVTPLVENEVIRLESVGGNSASSFLAAGYNGKPQIISSRNDARS